MASISKFSTALLSVPNEITVAAANFNLNFSLMKVEAPVEFRGLGDALSHKRRHEAEEGSLHITARCLGALFESIVPSIPKLTAAYGTRVSELSAQTQSTAQRTGMFADRAGADATSLWAAATSGQHAIAIHLLASMLARIWKPAEATSLWVELVERRKQEIFKAYNDSTATGISSIMAAQQIFRRDQLSAWDASARSWLQTADALDTFKRTQLMLIINNIRMPVNNSNDPYESVISAWISGMNTMEKLIGGVPQRVQDGAILLSISSWHLYPNMQVLSDEVKDINLDDSLMAGSVLTISTFGVDHDREGVFWSLPLSRMRYYSPPVKSERSLASDTSRITMGEFQIVFLGAFISQWKDNSKDVQRWCNLIIRLKSTYERHPKVYTPAWFKLIADAASRVFSATGHSKAQYLQLLRLGSRRCEDFLHDRGYKPPAFFGLEYFDVLVRAVENPEERIGLLRDAAKKRMPYQTIIRYRKEYPKLGFIYQYASVTPYKRNSLKRSADQIEIPSTGHRRFAVGRCTESKTSCIGDDACGCIDPTFGSCVCQDSNANCTSLCHPDTVMCRLRDVQLSFVCEEMACTESQPCPGCDNRMLRSYIKDEGEETVLIHPDCVEYIDEYQLRLRLPGEEKMRTYGLLLGSSSHAAVFQPKGYTYDNYHLSSSDFPFATIEEIELALTLKSFDPSGLHLETCCGSWSDAGYQQMLCSLEAFEFASRLYASMPGSTVSIEVMKSPLYKTSWAGDTLDSGKDFWSNIDPHDLFHVEDNKKSGHGVESETIVQSREVSTVKSASDGSGYHLKDSETAVAEEDEAILSSILRRSFGCIAWFDSGEYDIPARHLNGVMALVNGDSIYVASALLTDPSVDTRDTPIRRVFGSLGRSELSLLVPPADPRLSEPELSSWKQINHSQFDGLLQNCFSSTSLHLTFTESEDTIYMGNRGLRDRQVIFLEAVVSIDDRGRNVGDLDILSIFDKPAFVVQKSCLHESKMKAVELHSWQHLTAVDCWEEFLDPPENTAIFRATGNWQARLGAAAAAIQMGKKVFVLPEKTCLMCLGPREAAESDIVIA